MVPPSHQTMSVSVPGPKPRADRAAQAVELAAAQNVVDGRLVDLSHRIEHDAQVAVVTERDPDGVGMIRHSTAHLLAYAVKELFPEAQVTIGPVIDNGFYYDFSYKRPFTPEDLTRISADGSLGFLPAPP